MGRFSIVRVLFWTGVVIAVAAVPATMADLFGSAFGIFVDFCKGLVTIVTSLVKEGESATELVGALLALLG